MKNKKLLIVFVVLLVLTTSFLLFILKPNTKNKKLKELNYNVTYKQAFPNENLRRSVVLCIMRNKCGEEQYNSGAYNFKTYREKHKDQDFVDKYYFTRTYATDTSLGPEITEDEINTKAEEQISKTDLDKIQVFISNDSYFSHEVTGIEYLTNLKAVVLNNLFIDNVDFSYNKNLERVFLGYGSTLSYIKNVNLNQNTKLKEIAINFSYNGRSNKLELDYSMLNDLETLVIDNSSEDNIKLPLGIKILKLKNYDMKKTNLSELVNLKELDVDVFKSAKLDFSKNNKLEKLYLYNDEENKKIDSLDFNNNPNLKELDIENVGIKKINLDKNINLEKIKFSGNNLNELDLSKNTNLKDVILTNNNITNIKLNSEKVEKLDLSDNKYFKNINVTKFSNLKYLNLNNTMIKADTIDFSKNPLLEEFYISYLPNPHQGYYPADDNSSININSLDFSNNLNLKTLKVKAKLKKLNIEKNINLKDLDISINNITDLKAPNHLNYSTSQWIKIKVKKDTDVEIPVNFNGEKLYLNPSSNFIRNGDKYRFTKKGNFDESICSTKNGFTYCLYVDVEVVDKDENIDSSLTLIDQTTEDYRPGINEEIDVNQIRRMITNLPANTKKFEIVDPKPAKFKEKGKQILKVKVTFDDDTSKVYNLPINIYEKIYNSVEFDRKINGESVHILEKEGKCIFPCGIETFENKEFNYERNRQYIRTDCHCPGEAFNDTNLLARVNDEVLSYEYSGLPNGLSADQNGIHGKIDYKWRENEKEHTFYVIYKEKGHAYNIEETIKIKLLRDRDSDGIPDIYDDDVDGDGFSDVDELKAGSNPYDKNSTPNNITNVSKNTEADKFNPIIDQKNFKPLFNDKITSEEVKKVITNLPVDTKKFEVLRIFRSNTSEYTKIKVAVSITFKDNSKKEFDIPINAYKEEFLTPNFKIENKTILEGKKLDVDILKIYAKEEHIDDNNFIKYVKDKSEYYLYMADYGGLPRGLIYNSNSVNGVIDYLFTGIEEENTFNITYYEKFNHNNHTNAGVFSITLLRDTDKDGIPDKDDDDKDGDGVSNDIEIANGSDPYNKNIIPGMSKKEVLDVLVNDLEKLINDSENNSFENKNKLDVDKFKEEKLHHAKEILKETKESYNNTTLDDDIKKLIEKVREKINYLKAHLSYLKDKANFEELDKELLNILEKEDYYDEEIFKEYLELIKKAKNLSRDTATQEEVNELWQDLVYKRESLKFDKFDKTKFLNQIEEINEKLSNVKCTDDECSYIKEKILELYNESLSCEYLTIEEIIEIINKANKLLKNSKFTNPKTGIKTYSLIILFIIFISYKLIKKKKSYIR